MRWALAASCILAGLTPWAASAADKWPTRPITVICPFPAGISIDILARAMASALQEGLGQAVVVDNRPGAAANIGAALAARSAPDGYTLFVGTVGPVINNKYLYKNLGFDPERAFSPIVLLASSPMIIVGSPRLQASNLSQLLDYSRKNPGKVSAGTVGIGSQAHIALELINKLAGTKIAHVPYRDVNQALPDLMSGDLQVGLNYIPTFVPNVQSGMLKGLAVTSPQRLPDLPDIPTVAESGFPGFEASGWSALFAPTGTPRDVVAKINAIVDAYLQSESGKKQIGKLGMTTLGGTPEALAKYLEQESARWVPIIKEANISVE